MAKRGRPSNEGRIQGWMFIREMRLLEHFDFFRATMKNSAAITAAVEEYRKLNPTVPVSEGILRRLLVSRRSKQARVVPIPVAKTEETFQRERSELLQGLIAEANAPGYSDEQRPQIEQFIAAVKNLTHGARIQFGPRPEHPRFNAKSR